QAEDGIRDRNVTGVQTCALPISASCDSFPSRAQTRESWAIGSPNLGTIEETARVDRQRGIRPFSSGPTYDALLLILGACLVYARSEERRVGEEVGVAWTWWPCRE